MKQWNLRLLNRRALALAATIGLAATFGLLIWTRTPNFGLPFHDTFASDGINGWTSYAGHWTVRENAVRNDSDERGAKLVTGSSHWTSYAIETDIEILGGGDAGIIIRAGNIEDGVDWYDGYYAGLRTNDNSLILGRAQHGWYEFPTKPMPGGVVPNKWYHMRLAAQGCIITASASQIGTSDTVEIQARDPDCLHAGQAGLRSMGAGGLWRNVRIVPLPGGATQLESSASVSHMALYPTSQGSAPLTVAANPVIPTANSGTTKLTRTIGSLRLLSISRPAHVIVRGAVILTAPSLYIQDSSGGVRVAPAHPVSLRVGDEVEVEGDVYPEGFSATIRNANAVVVGGLAPIPPLSVTADQAATGTYDSMFVEVQGRLFDRVKQGNVETLEFHDGIQTFRALIQSDDARFAIDHLKKGSTVGLRGVCMVDPSYTGNTVPFILIVDSPDQIKLLVGPPWWSPQHLILLAIAMLAVGFVGHLLYSRAEEWRLRAVIMERERLAHEMHDTLSQSFAGIGFQLRAIRNRMLRAGSTIEAQPVLDDLNIAMDLVRHSHDEARRSIGNLRPETLEENGLLAALDQSARRTVARGSVAVNVSSSGDARQLPIRVLDALYWIGQEAIANAIFHGHPRNIGIHMKYDESSITLILDDDGTGFSYKPELSGFGLAGMRRRAEAVNATLDIQSASDAGTRVSVSMPLPRVSFMRRLAFSRRSQGYNVHAS